MAKLGIGKSLYHVIKSQFSKTESALKFDNVSSQFFRTLRGVRQGDTISPTLFNIFINDINDMLLNEKCSPLKLIDSEINNLLFADDIIIFSETKEGLQNSINNFSKYCDKWQLTVNIKKTKSMVFQRRLSKVEKPFIKYKNQFIDNVTEYKFLGSVICSNGNLNSSINDLAKKARKVLFALYSRFSAIGNVPIHVASNLFDSLVKPILTYNSEICMMDVYLPFIRAKTRAKNSNNSVDSFHFIDKTPFEKTHLSFCKHILGIRKCSSNLATRLELGRAPLENNIKVQSLLFLARLQTENINPLLKESFEACKMLDSQNIYSWYTYVKSIISENSADFIRLTTCKTLKEVKTLKNSIKEAIFNQYDKLCKTSIEKLNERNKLFLYKLLKINTDRDFYLSHSNFEFRKLVTKFRICDHSLELEVGRYKKLPRNMRICNFCSRNEIDDEFHFFFHCEKNQNIRYNYLSEIENENIDFPNLDYQQKLKHILNPTNFQQMQRLGSFLKRSMELRTRDSD